MAFCKVSGVNMAWIKRLWLACSNAAGQKLPEALRSQLKAKFKPVTISVNMMAPYPRGIPGVM